MDGVQIKSLTRGQIKTLRKLGYESAIKSGKDSDAIIEALEWIFDTVYPELAKNDDIEYTEVVSIARATYAKTYEVKLKDVKN